jgi:predicted nuclease of predicted toxin-antitoxin system
MVSSELDLLEYSQFLQSVSDLVILDPLYRAPLRDPSDLVVLQTADRGLADVLCTSDSDFRDPAVVAFCGAKGIVVCDEVSLLTRLA